MITLKDKVIVVTGGAGLLGFEFVKEIIRCKGIPVIADIDLAVIDERILLLKNEFGDIPIGKSVLDITNKESILDSINCVKNEFGQIDSLINNAYPRNKNYGRVFEEVEYFDFCENTNMNLGGYFLTSQQFVNFFQKQGYGNIVNISSIYGVIPPKFEVYSNTSMTMPVEYAVIKSGLIHLTKYMAKYLKGSNIRVNTLSPGGIFDNQDSSFIDKYNSFCCDKGMLDKNDLVGALVFLLSDSSKFIQGQNIVVDDGFSL